MRMLMQFLTMQHSALNNGFFGTSVKQSLENHFYTHLLKSSFCSVLAHSQIQSYRSSETVFISVLFEASLHLNSVKVSIL